MCDREEGKRPEPDALKARLRVEQSVENQMPAFVHRQTERAAGEKPQRVDTRRRLRPGRGRGRAVLGARGRREGHKHRDDKSGNAYLHFCLLPSAF